MVACDHLHPDPSAPTATDGGDRLGAWRVDHALEAEESQVAGDVAVLEPRVIGCHVTAGKSQHSQPLVAMCSTASRACALSKGTTWP